MWYGRPQPTTAEAGEGFHFFFCFVHLTFFFFSNLFNFFWSCDNCVGVQIVYVGGAKSRQMIRDYEWYQPTTTAAAAKRKGKAGKKKKAPAKNKAEIRFHVTPLLTFSLHPFICLSVHSHMPVVLLAGADHNV